MGKKKLSYILVENRSDLNRIAGDLAKETEIGADLEADSLFHYPEKICLLQISTGSKDILVDPLATGDLSPLSSIFSDRNIRKVFHGADYDIRSLYRDFGIEVNSLFDTQIAATFLGLRNTGLGDLLMERFGVPVEKKYQRSDWSKRPLSANMLAYALQDTRYLLPLSRILEGELRVKERLFWVEEECELLSKVRPSPPDNNPLFMKFKGAGRLDPRSLAVLEAILRLREEVAFRRNRPPFKVLGNSQIMDIVMKKPVTREDLEGLSPAQVKRLGASILKRNRAALNLPGEKLPVFPRKKGQALGSEVAKRIEVLRGWRKQRAVRLELDPSLICTNSQIQSLALANPGNPKEIEGIEGIRNWQKGLFGSEICSILNEIK